MLNIALCCCRKDTGNTLIPEYSDMKFIKRMKIILQSDDELFPDKRIRVCTATGTPFTNINEF